MTEELFRTDAYLKSINATVQHSGEGFFITDRTVFYPRGGGQPGDRGRVSIGGTDLTVTETMKSDQGIAHYCESRIEPHTIVELAIDWDYRHRLMRMHSALHLLSSAVPGRVTGGQIGDGKGRLDFDLPEMTEEKSEIEARINQWIREDRPVSYRWVNEDELEKNPDLVKTMSVRPPQGAGKVRLVEIEGVDLQACGGTHVRSTIEIGPVKLGKVEKKGKMNRRFNLLFSH